MVNKSPNLRNISTDEFINHVGGMSTRMQTLETEIEKVWVDVSARAVVLQVVYHLMPKGMDCSVDNQVIRTLSMDKQVEKVVEATEFLDAAAVGDLINMMKSE